MMPHSKLEARISLPRRCSIRNSWNTDGSLERIQKWRAVLGPDAEPEAGVVGEIGPGFVLL